MKTQLEEVQLKIKAAIDILNKEFSRDELRKDTRLFNVWNLLYDAQREPERFPTAELVVEYDPRTGRFRVNDELAQRYIRQRIEIARNRAEASNEIDFIVAQDEWEDTLIARVNGTYKPTGRENPRGTTVEESRFRLQTRLLLHERAARKIKEALA